MRIKNEKNQCLRLIKNKKINWILASWIMYETRIFIIRIVVKCKMLYNLKKIFQAKKKIGAQGVIINFILILKQIKPSNSGY